MEFHERLKELRKQRGFTQQALSVAVGMSTRNLQDIEYGKVDPSLSSFIRLATVLQVSLDDLACYHLNNEI